MLEILEQIMEFKLTCFNYVTNFETPTPMKLQINIVENTDELSLM